MTPYRRGYEFERRVAKALEEQGAVLVVRAGGSHGLADLVAFWPKGLQPWLVQCKRTGRMSKADQARMVDLAGRAGCVALVAETRPGGRGIDIRELKDASEGVGG